MDDEFRIPLERRIGSLRSQREFVQDELRERHRELNSIDRRIEAAEELYRREFGTEAPDIAAIPRMRRETRIKRPAAGQPPWREAVLEVLGNAGTPLHAKEIWRRLSESGFHSDAADPVRSVVAIAVRTEDLIHRTGPNTFALTGIEGQDGEQQGLPVDDGAVVARNPGEEQS